ncbi:hypothetical protein SAMN05443634_10387 [Chishuiella changwenlii]|uniref:Uncharacterized protein n=1 Tax=Chishuiella changwenlii TaxID=1434701 RepID=A0A1M6UWD2_9FLAO|nr:hypothetical protein [Chishuiella changwenlii]GGF07782.1 hypothetical protein GCM10010984_26210 [Chishuiella changwenlii]SHK73415.1 hypothetical protein SAMN05443634_10387 [Chishuiella changwenlii]
MKKLDTNWLSPDKIRILKRISFKSKLNPNVIGNIIYTRSFTNEYKLKLEKNEENEVDDIERIRSLMDDEYPRYDCYPNDSLDSSILNAVREIFPESSVENNLIIHELELEEIRLSIQSKIAICSNMNICWDENMNLKCNRYCLNIFSTLDKNEFSNLCFEAKIQKSDVEKLSTLEFK